MQITETKTEKPVKSLSRYKGFAMVIAASSLWGLSGTVAQTLFQDHGFTPGWLVTMRLLVAGALLLMFSFYSLGPRQTLAVWATPKEPLRMILFGLLGMLGVQYTYFVGIQYSNAATATFLQFLGPLLITVYLAVRARKMPSPRELAAVALALIGTFLLVTNGSLDGLTISPAALVWGLVSAVALAFYTLYPSQLIHRWGSVMIVGWGMLIGGIGLSLFNPPWVTTGQVWSLTSLCYVVFVILFGTLIPFYLYVDSLRYIKATETSLLASAEPLSATIASVFWLQVPLRLFESLGGLCIIATVTLLSLRSRSDRSS